MLYNSNRPGTAYDVEELSTSDESGIAYDPTFYCLFSSVLAVENSGGDVI